MIFIDRTQTDPYFNIAAEEYVLKNIDDDVFMLWVNSPSVIVGKHQIATAEANITYTHKHYIPVIRRISGGGTVYHDKGNLNYSLIIRGKKGQLVDYEKYAGTVIRTLKKLQLDARLQGKSSLYVAGKKFSGNAEHIFRDRVLHHGTLLFNSNLDDLRRCIRPSHQDYADKSIKSVDSFITNLNDHLPPEVDLESLKKMLFKQAQEDFMNARAYQFTEDDIRQIKQLVKNKYVLDDWNFGYSPKYKLSRNILAGPEEVRLEMSCEKGHIVAISFLKDGKEIMSELKEKLINSLHHPSSVMRILADNNQIIERNVDINSFTASLF